MTQQWQHVFYQFENHNHFNHNTHQYTTLIYFVAVEVFTELWPQRLLGISFAADRREGGGWPCSEDGSRPTGTRMPPLMTWWQSMQRSLCGGRSQQASGNSFRLLVTGRCWVYRIYSISTSTLQLWTLYLHNIYCNIYCIHLYIL